MRVSLYSVSLGDTCRCNLCSVGRRIGHHVVCKGCFHPLNQPGKNKIKRIGSLCNISKWTLWTPPTTKSSDEFLGSISVFGKSRMLTFILENEIILVEIHKSSPCFYSQELLRFLHILFSNLPSSYLLSVVIYRSVGTLDLYIVLMPRTVALPIGCAMSIVQDMRKNRI